MMYYTGIGSRKTPKEICRKMTRIAERLSEYGYTLRSGGADKADSAFEEGATQKEIFLPWNGFNNRFEDHESYIVPKLNMVFVEQFHPKPSALSSAGKLLMSRNTYQVLGKELKTPSEFVLCWTEDGKASGELGRQYG